MAYVDPPRVARTGLGSAVREAWGMADTALLETRMNYWMNESFYRGHQWVWWSNEHRNVQMVPGRRSDNDRVHARINGIRFRVNSLKGRMTGRPLTFEVVPSATDDATLQAARTGSQLLESRRVADGWEEIRVDAVFSAWMGGTALVMPYWNPHSGEVEVEAYNIAEFTLEPGTRRPRDSRYLILARALPPAQVQARYGLSECPPADSASGATPGQRRLTQGLDRQPDMTIVYQYIERPDRDGKGGRVATIVNDEVVEYEDWPFPFKTLPGYVFRCDIIPQQWTGDTPVNDARPVQAAINLIRSTMLENAKKAGWNKLLVPIGSGLDDMDITDEPGEVLPYMPDSSGARPSWLEAPSLPRDFRYETERLENEMDNILFTHAASRGVAADRQSGLALSIAAEKDDTPLGAFARDQQQGWATIASQVLQMYAAKVTKPRTARVAVPGMPPVTIEWTGKMLGNQTDVIVPSDAVMPHSRVATQAMLMDLKGAFPEQFRDIDQETLFRIADMPGLNLVKQAMDADVTAAVYENTMMAQGEVMLPRRFDNHAIHMAEHNRERKLDRYRLASPEVQSTYDDHIAAHEQLMAEEVARARTLNEAIPGLAAMPQGDEPAGSLMPPDHISAASGAPAAFPAGPRPPV